MDLPAARHASQLAGHSSHFTVLLVSAFIVNNGKDRSYTVGDA